MSLQSENYFLCRICKINKSKDNFYVENKRGRKYTVLLCRECKSINRKKYPSPNNDRTKNLAKLRRKNNLKRYLFIYQDSRKQIINQTEKIISQKNL